MLAKALEQLPDAMSNEHENLATHTIRARIDSAGATREFLNHLHAQGLQFSTSLQLNGRQ